jgi:hypothetical protein
MLMLMPMLMLMRYSFCVNNLSVLPPSIVQAPHISLALAGVEIISNGSGSHHQLRKLDQRLNLIRGATAKVRTKTQV